MARNNKHLGLIVLGSLTVLMSSAFADQRSNESAQLRNLDNRVTALEQKKGMSSLINPPAGPRVRHGADLFLTADALIWQAQENGVPLAQQVSGHTTQTVNIDHRWNAGFRVGVGYNLPHDGWDLGLTWLRYYTGGQTTARIGSGGFDAATNTLLPSQSKTALATGVVGNYATYAYGGYKLHLNQLDLDLGRNFFVSKWLAIRPHVGLRNDWIWQRWNINYAFNSGLLGEATQSDRINDRLKYWGIGPVGGFDTQWGLGSGFSIYGNGALAILYGFFKNTRDDVILLLEGGPISSGTYHSHAFNHICRFVADFEVGLRWDRMFMADQFHFQIQAGWEQHMYFGMNQLPTVLSTADDAGKSWQNQGDLTLQGWTLSMRFDF